jgi:Ca2+-transporting ATPase
VLTKALAQGIAIAATSFLSYYYLLTVAGVDAAVARGVGLGIMLIASIALVFVNSSDYDYAFVSIRRLLRDKIMWGAVIGVLGLLFIALYSPLNGFFNLAPLSLPLLSYMLGAGILSVLWFEVVKVFMHIRT